MTLTHRSRTLACAIGLLASVAVSLGVAPAHADDSVIKVVGTTDVSDSGLVQNVIEPDFEKATGIDLQYTPQGTGAAIASAKTGSFSALLVHAASLENQFVADGYSAEPYGRSLFWGDYVLLGPKGDPAGVTSGGQPSSDAAAAFAKIAAAGASGKAKFVSRGSTPGTTVQEHAIWALTSGVSTCTVSAAQGGGKAPVTSDAAGSDCSTTETSRPYPSWYKVTGFGQAANVTAGDQCGDNVGGNGSNCYVFTDRGTYAYLQSQGQAKNLQIVARDNAASAPGGADLLVNSFHGYAINPAKFDGGGQVSAANAKKFLDFLTSPEEQKKIGAYLGTGRSAGFIPSAAPLNTSDALPTKVTAGSTVTIRGGIANATPGTPTLSGVPVDLYAATSGGQPTKVDSFTSNSVGRYIFSVKPTQGTTYSVRTPQITKIENAALNPQFGDILQPMEATIGTVGVGGAVTITSGAPGTGANRHIVTIKGTVAPAAGTGAKITVFRVPGKGATSAQQGAAVVLAQGATSWTVAQSFPTGAWRYYVRYTSPGVSASYSAVKSFQSPK
ncbi:hypothetical protein GCM10011519_03410 [Marmoricola endophyticus]|uniref:PBP domain-containing protein n=1 Tax=Marmoricola endophyticus TaxID=2040280 RepID=A0A917F0Q4_9ACTN|nr:substrate-binding domain-containing protein [Marmoricola endophyticus]GGF33266.1 hypothetical protein GCM10011519_03410 [Marmoricola endophyticus]